MNTGRIILLNGSSSAGKTTLARALQDTLTEPYHHLALDHFRDGMPGRYRGLNSPDETPGALGLNVVPVARGGARVTEIRFGAWGRQMLRGMRRAVAAFAAEGNNVIVDDIMFERAFLEDYLVALAGFSVLFVGVRCPLDTVNERETHRAGRFPGTAVSHFDAVHVDLVYDVEVDTSCLTPRECAEVVVRRLEDAREPRAFDCMRRRWSR